MKTLKLFAIILLTATFAACKNDETKEEKQAYDDKRAGELVQTYYANDSWTDAELNEAIDMVVTANEEVTRMQLDIINNNFSDENFNNLFNDIERDYSNVSSLVEIIDHLAYAEKLSDEQTKRVSSAFEESQSQVMEALQKRMENNID